MQFKARNKISGKISGKAWVNRHLDAMTKNGRLYGADMLFRVCGAILVDGRRTPEEWNALLAIANSAEVSMKDAANYEP